MRRQRQDSSKSPKSDFERAYTSALRMLARRDHSEKELKEKLKEKTDAETIERIIDRLKELKYLKEPSELAAAWARTMAGRGRGRMRVAQELKKRGLPAVAADREQEISLCREVFERRFGEAATLSTAERAKAFRYLTYRGFDAETVNKVLREEVHP